MAEGFAGEAALGLLQQSRGLAQVIVGNALFFVALFVAAQFYAQQFGRGFDLFHGIGAMAFVIVVGLGQRDIGLAQEVHGRGLGAAGEDQ